MFTQAAHSIAVSTSLGEDVLLLRSFEGEEAISRLFRFELVLLSENSAVSYDSIVGQPVTVRVALADGSPRFWNGFVSRFVQAGRDSGLAVYRATVVPWLWFLDQTTDCRIFQNKKVPDILQQIFHEYSFRDFSLRLYGDFSERDYCVQYRESDFNFVSRLMEEEGIFYFFEHEKGKHTLILGNDPSAHKPCPKQAKARYEVSAGGWQDDDVVLQWALEREYRPGVYSATDYNFETPTTSLLTSVNGKGKYEIYDYPGDYAKRSDGDSLARIRLQEQQLPRTVARGLSDCRAFGVGYRFDLEDHFRQDLNQTYVLTALHHSGQDQGYASGSSGSAGGAAPQYQNSFECIPLSTPIRPLRRTPVPVVQGCQTGVVVGPAGEEIFTDKYGRVKVQFHWDREGKKNESSSCWVRVSYPWSGKGWGGIQIPRIGQEVIIDFVEGDPDRPIITGRVYNAGQMPPWDLPAKKMLSGYKSNSTLGGGGYNELSFDDTKGTELIQVHGQFDMDTKIEHDERRHVINNRTKNVDQNETSTIGANRTEKVGVNEDITIGSNRTEKVGAEENITIGANRTEHVASNETISIGSSRTETVGASESITVAAMRTRNVGINEMVNIGAAQEVTIGGLQALTVGLTRLKTIGVSETVNIGTTQSIHVGTNLTETTGNSHKETVGQNRTASIGKDDFLKVGKTLVIDAGDEIVFKTGKASIAMKKDGTIMIEGKDVTVKGSGKITEHATGDIVHKGNKIHKN